MHNLMKKKVFTAVVSEPKIITKIINQSQLNKLCLNYMQPWALGLNQNCVFSLLLSHFPCCSLFF